PTPLRSAAALVAEWRQGTRSSHSPPVPLTVRRRSWSPLLPPPVLKPVPAVFRLLAAQQRPRPWMGVTRQSPWAPSIQFDPTLARTDIPHAHDGVTVQPLRQAFEYDLVAAH